MTGTEDIVDLAQARRVITQLREEQDEAVEKAVAPLKRQVLELTRVNAQQRLQEGRLDIDLARLRAELAQRRSNSLFNRKLADLESRGYEVIGRILHKEGQYALFDSSCRWLSKEQYQRLMHEQDGSLFAPRAQPNSERDAALWRAFKRVLRTGHIPGVAHGRRFKIVETCPMYGDETEFNDFVGAIEVMAAQQGESAVKS